MKKPDRPVAYATVTGLLVFSIVAAIDYLYSGDRMLLTIVLLSPLVAYALWFLFMCAVVVFEDLRRHRG